MNPCINRSADIVVIGGGPVGLWTAIQTKIRNPSKEIVIVEKSLEYQRASIRLKLRPSSFSGIPANCPSLTKLVTKWKSQSEVPIKEMETSLVSCAEKLGIKISKGTPANLATLQTDYPKAKVFIGADGAKSGMRQWFFNDKKRFDRTLQHIVQVQYMIRTPKQEVGSAQKIKESMNSYKKLKFAGCFIEEKIRSIGNNQSLVTLRIFIDKATYDSMPDATFRTPYYFEDLCKIPSKLRLILIKWWGVQEEQAIIPNSQGNKITVIRLNSTASKQFMTASEKSLRPHDRIVTVLVGDAAQSFPFFRSINNGLLLGTRLSKTIQNAFAALDDGPSPRKEKQAKTRDDRFVAAFHSYSRYAAIRATMEYIIAYIKNCFLNLTNYWIEISGQVPWQVNKISYGAQKKAYDKGALIWEALSGQEAPPWVDERSSILSFRASKQEI